MRVRLFTCFRFIVEKMDASVPNLEKIDVTGNDVVVFKSEIEPALAVIINIPIRKEHPYFHRNGDRVIHQHETLQGFMSLLVVWCCWQREGCDPGCKVLFPLHWRTKIGGKFG